MTVCSADPYYLTLADVPAADKARELAIAEKEVAEDPKLTAKPDNVKAMIAQRKVDSRLGENCLESKAYALDPEGKLAVKQFCAEKGVQVLKFVRYKVGEGLPAAE
jgi:elongation factor Ts